MSKRIEFFTTTKPLVEGELDPIAQMCIDEESKGVPGVEVFYAGLNAGGKITSTGQKMSKGEE